ncbi:hypothetical protein M378DRAFT_163338 [Amanita muscaria Koide BX008]|uniref:Uncharacterized protein n=1 Tax=Amanita muscaria (strain Koide BX008) TaxID=946122 RepID=A0A0C2SM62_AMAMK|nr:hypothetical protein M378DRAFT_163338 [Amanita muscaria Koide BX008]
MSRAQQAKEHEENVKMRAVFSCLSYIMIPLRPERMIGCPICVSLRPPSLTVPSYAL